MIFVYQKPQPILHCPDYDFAVMSTGAVARVVDKSGAFAVVAVYDADKESWEINPYGENKRFRKVFAQMETYDEARKVALAINGAKPGSTAFRTMLTLIADENPEEGMFAPVWKKS